MHLKELLRTQVFDISGNLKACKSGETISPCALYRGAKVSGSCSAQNFKKKPSHWICVSPLDLGNKAPPGTINDTSWASKCQ